jgi:hypothetical protein
VVNSTCSDINMASSSLKRSTRRAPALLPNYIYSPQRENRGVLDSANIEDLAWAFVMVGDAGANGTACTNGNLLRRIGVHDRTAASVTPLRAQRACHQRLHTGHDTEARYFGTMTEAMLPQFWQAPPRYRSANYTAMDSFPLGFS